MKQFIYPYIFLENSLEAAKYYKKIFNGEITYIMYGKDTPDCPKERHEEVMHLQLQFNNNQIFMADEKGEPNNLIQIHLDYQDKEELITVFNRFREKSVIVQELSETHWGAYFGVIKDKYGITWQFHYMFHQE
ncbi:hypothetical protein KQ51_00491 [Candidatus Izimaplasma bacterium HR1]|jgi:PhnB protein|uniref:VOC family protein n=1 Tax=Candidatus Izimoplasma sp. HR1 TaxID=1541959 RepID=UPI0004F7CDC4|nr:hypothetical protein KQ51_00491 [Candidatus Izimaplasma bacterium HR1]